MVTFYYSYYQNWQQPDNATHLIDRGFCMHQHLDCFHLINMEGRMYDPVVAKFLSPDPYVQAADNTQNLNRYAYCMNNPIMFSDPTGEKLKGWQWGLIALGADLLTGGAISLTAATTATAATAHLTTSAVSLTAFNTTITTILLPIQTTISSIDFFTSTIKSIKDKDSKTLENWGRIELGLFLSIPGWEDSQTLLGNSSAHVRNALGYVDDVSFNNMSVFVYSKTSIIGGGMTLGPFIQGDGIELSDIISQHEYGHTIQSRILGPLYLPKVAIASGSSALYSYYIQKSSTEEYYHDRCWYEVWANQLAGVQESGSYYRSYRNNDFWYWALVAGLSIFPN